MDLENFKLSINQQISKSNKAFSNYWGGLYVKGLMSEDIVELENVQKKVKRNFNFFYYSSIVFSILLITISLLEFFEFSDSFKMDKIGLSILLTITFLLNTFRFYKIKANLEFKIYLLGLLKNA